MQPNRMLTNAKTPRQDAQSKFGIQPGGGKVRCPFCHRDELNVTDSRLMSGWAFWVVRRRRHCGHCRRSFLTYEMLQSIFDGLEKARATVADFKKLLEGKPTSEG